MSEVFAGERITVVLLSTKAVESEHDGIVTDLSLDTLRATVSDFHKSYSSGQRFRYQTGWHSSGMLVVNDEGRTWCRDWLEKDDPKVLAMFTAYTLMPRAIDLREADKLYFTGVISLDRWKANLNLWDDQE